MAKKQETTITPEAFDAITADLNQAFITGIEKDGLQWVDYLVRGSFGFNHANPLTMKEGMTYNGRNCMRLALSGYKRNYSSPNWTTAKNAIAQGWKIRKNAHPVLVEHWSTRNVKDEKGNIIKGEDGCNVKTSRVFRDKPALVYNYGDLEGAPCEDPKKVIHLGEEDTLAMTYMVIQAWEEFGGCHIELDDHIDVAYYDIAKDTVFVASAERFMTAKQFAGTVLHEIIHSTGAKGRTGRIGAFCEGSFKHSREELTAEIGASYLECALGIDSDHSGAHFDQHAAYVKSWSKRFTDKPDAIFKAANDAKYGARLVLDAIRKYQEKHPDMEVTAAFTFVEGMDELLAA